MLGKVLKYDLKWTYKILIVFYILSIITAILARICMNVENSMLFTILGSILNGTMIAMLVNGLVNCLIRSWVRFSTNIYKDESYLTHTLPIKKSTIYVSKVLMAMICSFTTVLLSLLCLFIYYYTKDNLEGLKTFLKLEADSYDVTIFVLLLTISIVIFLELLFITLIGYDAIIIGQRSNKGKMVKTFIWGIGLYFGTSSLTLALVYIVGLFNKGVMNVINTTEIVNASAIKSIMIIGIIIYLVYNIIYYIIGNLLFKKGVNVD